MKLKINPNTVVEYALPEFAQIAVIFHRDIDGDERKQVLYQMFHYVQNRAEGFDFGMPKHLDKYDLYPKDGRIYLYKLYPYRHLVKQENLFKDVSLWFIIDKSKRLAFDFDNIEDSKVKEIISNKGGDYYIALIDIDYWGETPLDEFVDQVGLRIDLKMNVFKKIIYKIEMLIFSIKLKYFH